MSRTIPLPPSLSLQDAAMTQARPQRRWQLLGLRFGPYKVAGEMAETWQQVRSAGAYRRWHLFGLGFGPSKVTDVRVYRKGAAMDVQICVGGRWRPVGDALFDQVATRYIDRAVAATQATAAPQPLAPAAPKPPRQASPATATLPPQVSAALLSDAEVVARYAPYMAQPSTYGTNVELFVLGKLLGVDITVVEKRAGNLAGDAQPYVYERVLGEGVPSAPDKQQVKLLLTGVDHSRKGTAAHHYMALNAAADVRGDAACKLDAAVEDGVQNVPGDGACMFHAVGLQVGRDAASLRAAVVAWIAEHGETAAFWPQTGERLVDGLRAGLVAMEN